MSRTFRFLLWYLCFPFALLIFVYPPRIHGYLNPYDEGLWLGLAQALIERKKLYHDVFFHYGPIIPWILRVVLERMRPTLSLVREVFWGLNLSALLVINFCLLRFVRTRVLRIALSLAMWCVPLAAHVLTIPMAARYGVPFASIFCWSFEASEQASDFWAACSGLLAALAFWVSQEAWGAVLVGGLVYFGLSKRRQTKWFFAAGCAIGLASVLLGLGFEGTQDFWHCAVSGTATMVFRNTFSFPFPRSFPFATAIRSWATTGALILPSVSYATVIVWTLHRFMNRHFIERFTLALAVFGSLMALPAWTQPDQWHIYFALSPALLLWGYEAERMNQTRMKKTFAIGLVTVTALFLTVPHALNTWRKDRQFLGQSRQSRLERAGASRLPLGQGDGYEALVEEIDRQIPKNQTFVFYPYDGSIYFLADRPNPTFLPVLALAVNEPMQQRVVKEMTLSGVQWVIWDKEDNAFKGVPIEQFLITIDRYITSHFTLRSSLGPFRFLKRSDH